SRRLHTRSKRDWSSDVCSSDLHSPRHQIGTGLTDLFRGQVTDIDPLHHPNTVVAAQGPGQLPVTDIHSGHVRGGTAQQHIGEPTGRSTGVQGTSSGHIEGEGVERTDELVRPA